MSGVNEKNQVAVEQSIKDLTAKVYDQQVRIDGLNATISSVFDRLNALETTLNLIRAAQFGHGPTKCIP